MGELSHLCIESGRLTPILCPLLKLNSANDRHGYLLPDMAEIIYSLGVARIFESSMRASVTGKSGLMTGNTRKRPFLVFLDLAVVLMRFGVQNAFATFQRAKSLILFSLK